jgi:hypothetical protein
MSVVARNFPGRQTFPVAVQLGVEYRHACNDMFVRLCVVWRLTVSFQYISIQLKQRQFDLILEDFAYGIQPRLGHCTYRQQHTDLILLTIVQGIVCVLNMHLTVS